MNEVKNEEADKEEGIQEEIKTEMEARDEKKEEVEAAEWITLMLNLRTSPCDLKNTDFL